MIPMSPASTARPAFEKKSTSSKSVKALLSPFSSLSRESETSCVSDLTVTMSPFKIYATPEKSNRNGLSINSSGMFELSNEEASTLVNVLDPIVSPATNAAEGFAALRALAFDEDWDTESVRSDDGAFTLFELTSPGLRTNLTGDEDDLKNLGTIQFPFDMGGRLRKGAKRLFYSSPSRVVEELDLRNTMLEDDLLTPPRRTRNTGSAGPKSTVSKQLFLSQEGEDLKEEPLRFKITGLHKNRKLPCPKASPPVRRRGRRAAAHPKTGSVSSESVNASSPFSATSNSTIAISPKIVSEPLTKRRKLQSVTEPEAHAPLNLNRRRIGGSGFPCRAMKAPLVFTSATGAAQQIEIQPMFARRRTTCAAPSQARSSGSITFATKKKNIKDTEPPSDFLPLRRRRENRLASIDKSK